MVFTIVSPCWTTDFLRCSGYFRNPGFCADNPHGVLGTSIFIFPHKVTTRMSQQPVFAMIITLWNRVFHKCPVYFRNRVYVADTPCGGVGTSISTPPVYFSILWKSSSTPSRELAWSSVRFSSVSACRSHESSTRGRRNYMLFSGALLEPDLDPGILVLRACLQSVAFLKPSL